MHGYDLWDGYGIRHLPAHLIHTKQWDTLARIIADLAYIDAKVKWLGITPTMEDYAALEADFPHDHTRWKEIDQLYRLIREESYAVRSWDSKTLPVLFLQHIRNRAFERHWPHIQKQAEHLLAQKDIVWLRLIRRLGVRRSQVTQAMGHGAVVQSVTFSPDGRYLASGGNDYIVRLWNVRTDKEERQFEGHNARVTKVLFSPDGRKLLSVADERGYGNIRLWDPQTGALLEMQRAPAGVLCASYSSDGLLIATGDHSGSLCIWDAERGSLLWEFKHPDWINDIEFSRDNRFVVSACDDGFVRLWEVETGREVRRLGGHEGGCKAAAFSLDDRLIAWGVGEPESCVCVYDLQPDDLKWKRVLWMLWPYAKSNVECLAFSPNGTRLAVGTWSDQILLLDTADGRETSNWTGHDGPVLDVCFSHGGEMLSSGSLDGTIRLWRVSYVSKPLSLGQRLLVIQRFLSMISAYLVETVKLLAGWFSQWHPFSRHWLKKLYPDSETIRLAFSGNGRLAAIAAFDGQEVTIWDMKRRVKVQRIEAYGSVWRLTLSSDGQLLAVGSFGGVDIWEAITGNHVQSMPMDGYPESVAISRDRQLLVSSNSDGEVYLWKIEDGALLAKHRISGEESITSFSRRGNLVRVLDFRMPPDAPNMWTFCIEGLKKG